MKVVLGSALRRALASLVLCVGVWALLFTVLARWQDDTRPMLGGGPKIPLYLIPPVSPRSQWDIPLAVGFAVMCLLAAALIYPRRPQLRLFLTGISASRTMCASFSAS